MRGEEKRREDEMRKTGEKMRKEKRKEEERMRKHEQTEWERRDLTHDTVWKRDFLPFAVHLDAIWPHELCRRQHNMLNQLGTGP